MSDETRRLDTWLWYARFFKTRTRATDYCNTGGIRVNSTLISKAHYLVRPGDVLTFPVGQNIRIVRILALGSRRGPATQAQQLYEDLSPAAPTDVDAPLPSTAARPIGSGRPTKADRRAIDRLRSAR